MSKLTDINAYPVKDLLPVLLQDKSTKKNIIWATDAYADFGPGYDDTSIIAPSLLSKVTLQPRISKTLEEQQARTRKKAEGMTPVWLCNKYRILQIFEGVGNMIKVLFVCHGNICRSPMAEYVMKDLVKKSGCAERFFISSAATSQEEIGNPVYPPARRKLAEHGISCSGHSARQLVRSDYERYDYFIGMDQENLREMYRILGADPGQKLSLLMDHTERPGEVADPWYTRDFEATWRDVEDGCRRLLEALCHGAD